MSASRKDRNRGDREREGTGELEGRRDTEGAAPNQVCLRAPKYRVIPLDFWSRRHYR